VAWEHDVPRHRQPEPSLKPRLGRTRLFEWRKPFLRRFTDEPELLQGSGETIFPGGWVGPRECPDIPWTRFNTHGKARGA
jgi:hypothetical protein